MFPPRYCHGCGATGMMASVSDPFSDACYGLCQECLGKALPGREEILRRIELNTNGQGWPPDYHSLTVRQASEDAYFCSRCGASWEESSQTPLPERADCQQCHKSLRIESAA